jgi:hypothetical protein
VRKVPRFALIGVALTAVVLFAAIAVQGQTALTAPVQWSGNGHWYQVVSVDSWEAGQQWAQDRGGYLATVTSLEENAFLVSILDQGPWNAYLGGYEPDNDGVWMWITGEPWSYTNWIPGQPSGDGNFLGLTPSSSWGWGMWNDAASGPGDALVEYPCYMPSFCFDLGADMNCDGADDVFDVIYLIDYVFSGGPARVPCPQQ